MLGWKQGQAMDIGLVRADSGFYSNKFLKWFKKEDLNCYNYPYNYNNNKGL